MSGKPKVLLIDNNLIVCQWVEAILAPEIEVITHHSAAGAVAAVRQAQPDLVLTEVDVPGYDGGALIRQIKSSVDGARVPVVLYDYCTPEELEAKAQSWSADAWLEKTGDGAAFKRRLLEMLPTAGAASTPSVGTLPARDEGDAQTVTASIVSRAPPAGPAQQTRRILIVGDDCLSAFERRAFSRPDIEAATVKSGARALDVLGLSRVDLVIIGPDPEDMSAEALCQGIRRDRKRQDVSILYLAPRFVTRPPEVMVQAGANTVLERPLDASEFAQAVSTLTQVAVRRDVRVIVRMRVEARDGSIAGVGFTQNLSASGILIETQDELEVGSTRVLRFFVPGSKDQIETTAEVVRLHNRTHAAAAFGMRFVDIREPQRSIIEDFIASQRTA